MDDADDADRPGDGDDADGTDDRDPSGPGSGDADASYDDWAELYDAFVPDSVGGDREFYADRAERADGPVLEVGCGTGRIYLELLRRGVDADGIDLSGAALSVLRRRAAAEGLSPSVRRADMTDFETDREYALVTVPFRALLHATTVADRVAALRAFRRALAPGGELVLNAFAPSPAYVAEHYGATEVERAEVDGRTVRQEQYVTLADDVEWIARNERRFYDDRTDELLAEAETRVALVTRPQFELLFERAGFDEYEVYGGFDLDPLERADQEMVWIARP